MKTKTKTTTKPFIINEIDIYMNEYLDYLREISERIQNCILTTDYIDTIIENVNITLAKNIIKKYDILSFSDFVSFSICNMINDENNQYEICEKMMNEIRLSQNNQKLSTLLYFKFMANVNSMINSEKVQIDIDELYNEYIKLKSDIIMKIHSSITSEYNMTEIEIMKNIRI